jgi:hypothetical protein
MVVANTRIMNRTTNIAEHIKRNIHILIAAARAFKELVSARLSSLSRFGEATDSVLNASQSDRHERERKPEIAARRKPGAIASEIAWEIPLRAAWSMSIGVP